MMNGCTIPYTPIAIDFWKSRKCSKERVFFLSHVELDQLCGLSSCWALPIYCSQVSKKLLIHWFQASIFFTARRIACKCGIYRVTRRVKKISLCSCWWFRQVLIFGRPCVKQFALCYRTVVCPVCDVGVLWPNG